VRHRDFRNSRRRDFDADTDYLQPRAFGTRPRFIQPRFEAPSGPPVSGVVKWFSPERDLVSSNSRTDQVTPFFTEAC